MAILKQIEFKNPLQRTGRCVYFEETHTGLLFSALVGAVCAPDLAGRPGFGVLVAIDHQEDPRLKSVPTADRWLRVLTEFEEFNFEKLIYRCIALRNKLCGRELFIPAVSKYWLSSELDSACQRALVDINRSLKRGKKFYLSAVQDQDMDFPNLVRTLYSVRQSLDLSRAKRLKAVLAAFGREQAKVKDAHKLWPGICALALSVNAIVAGRLWESPQIDIETRSLSDRRLDMLEKGSGTAFDEYERCLVQHEADQSRWVQGVDYDDYCAGETIPTMPGEDN